jgi:hypothetical protein
MTRSSAPDLPDAFIRSSPTVAGMSTLDEFILSSRSRAELASPTAIGCHDAVARCVADVWVSFDRIIRRVPQRGRLP